MKIKNYISLFIWIAITTTFFLYTFNNQPTVDYQECVKCDGNKYIRIYNYFDESVENYDVKFPFNNRISFPFLATKIGFNQPIYNFNFLNYIFSILSIILLFVLWKKLKIPSILIFIGFFWLIFHWTGMIRLYIYDPMVVDLPLYLFHTALVYIIYEKKYNWLPFLSIIAISQKESFMIYLGILLLYSLLHNNFKEKHFPLKPIVLSLLFAIITKVVINYFFPSNVHHPGSIIAVLFYIKQIFLYPLSLVRWVVAIFIAFGGLFLLAIQHLKQTYKTSPELNLLSLLMIISLLLGIVAGGDFTRIIFLGFPFVMTWILIILKEKHRLLSISSLLLSLPIMRLFQIISEPDHSTNSHEWYPEFSSMGAVSMWAIYMIICYWALHRLSIYLVSRNQT